MTSSHITLKRENALSLLLYMYLHECDSIVLVATERAYYRSG